MKKAFITGITGQEGSYLVEFLLANRQGRWYLISKYKEMAIREVNDFDCTK